MTPISGRFCFVPTNLPAIVLAIGWRL
jgi:hypothetical protein